MPPAKSGCPELLAARSAIRAIHPVIHSCRAAAKASPESKDFFVPSNHLSWDRRFEFAPALVAAAGAVSSATVLRPVRCTLLFPESESAAPEPSVIQDSK